MEERIYPFSEIISTVLVPFLEPFPDGTILETLQGEQYRLKNGVLFKRQGDCWFKDEMVVVYRLIPLEEPDSSDPMMLDKIDAIQQFGRLVRFKD